MSNRDQDIGFQYMTKRIGSTTYKIKVVFCDTGQETMEDKILRIVRNEVLQNAADCGIIEPPQVSRQKRSLPSRSVCAKNAQCGKKSSGRKTENRLKVRRAIYGAI